jgi:type II secretory pathway pseudopilin PulG
MINLVKNKGFALLYAMLVLSVVLSVSMGLFNVVMRYYSIESSARESQHAFYAADSAAECVYYWDSHWQDNGLSNSPFPENDTDIPVPNDKVYCAGVELKTISDFTTVTTADTGTTNFTLPLAGDIARNAKVIVVKNSTTKSKVLTVSGHNTTDDESPRLVERTIVAPFGE